jgi:hypothetical protein
MNRLTAVLPAPARTPRTAALIMVMGIGPFAAGTCLAALPELQQSPRTSATVAQLTLTAFIVGMGAGQLGLGPSSDSPTARAMTVFFVTALALASLTRSAAAPAPQGCRPSRRITGAWPGTMSPDRPGPVRASAAPARPRR